VEQGLSYRELKQMSRNALEHSFLPASEKARLRQRLDAAFVRFEARETVRSDARRSQHRTGTTGTIAH
jgi:adenosine deaminase